MVVYGQPKIKLRALTKDNAYELEEIGTVGYKVLEERALVCGSRHWPVSGKKL